MKIDARLTHSKVQFDQETTTHLVVSVTAPAVLGEDKRPPLCIVPLIDVSPSMDGDKFVYAKRSLIKLIEHLSANDYCGLIKFSSSAELVSKPVKCTVAAKEELKRAVGELTLSGGTNIASALLKGFEVANNMDLPGAVITRVILFTDGAANLGPAVIPADILNLVKPNIGIASVSAFGYGADAEQDFLSDLSRTGNGNYSYVQNPDDALSAFGKELGGLLSTYATNLVLDIEPLSGHELVSVVSDVEVEDQIKGAFIKIPNILSEETRHIVLEVKLKPQTKALPRSVNTFEINLGYDILDANLTRQVHIIGHVKAKTQFVKDGASSEPDATLDHIVGLAQLSKAQIEAEEQAKSGRYDQASAIMANCSSQMGRRGLSNLGVIAASVGSKLSSRSMYAENSGYLTSMQRGVTRGFGGTYDTGAAADLSLMGVSLNNTSQVGTSASFTSDHVDLSSVGGDYRDLTSVPWGANGTGGDVNVTLGDLPAPVIAPPPRMPAKKVDSKKNTLSQKSKRW